MNLSSAKLGMLIDDEFPIRSIVLTFGELVGVLVDGVGWVGAGDDDGEG